MSSSNLLNVSNTNTEQKVDNPTTLLHLERSSNGNQFLRQPEQQHQLLFGGNSNEQIQKIEENRNTNSGKI